MNWPFMNWQFSILIRISLWQSFPKTQMCLHHRAGIIQCTSMRSVNEFDHVWYHSWHTYANKGVFLHATEWISGDQRSIFHDDVIKWKHFSRYWPFVWGIHRSPVNSHHKGQRRGALIFFLIGAWTKGWVNNRDAGDLRYHRTHYDVTVMHGWYS